MAGDAVVFVVVPEGSSFVELVYLIPDMWAETVPTFRLNQLTLSPTIDHAIDNLSHLPAGESSQNHVIFAREGALFFE